MSLYPYPAPFRYAADAGLVADIVKAINGEYSAIACYEGLSALAPGEEERNRILEIRQDEIGHFRVFNEIYYMLTGKRHEPQMTESCPSEYRAGVMFAFKDEQETVDFYHEIADKAHHPYIKEQFRRAAADEQNHAVWFLFLLTQPVSR
ncbi:ferritin-like domain-containing protein [Paenibacillus hamazuiensis]|uniref:ferritin-like domain-containing protein n=1 Tax=Paenibacillus hamazuiensis TaxID=2936508 RepID=UPI00200ECE3A|nr:ferritin-like domain-containing protein [Paenibacillus hamazuiensis]